MAFHDVRLPEDVEKGAAGGPRFNTSIITMSSGHEQLNIDWSEMRSEWDVSYGIQTKEDFDVVKAFFYARRGMGHYFRFKDWADFELDDELIGTGTGIATTFQVVKTYESAGPAPYARRITRLVSGTLVVKKDGVTQTLTTHYTVSASGLITFLVAPADGALITVSGEFDVPVRFNTDRFTLILETFQAGAIGSLPVVERRE